MKLQLNSFRVSLARVDKALDQLVAAELGIAPNAVKSVRILRESIDARKKVSLAFVYNLEFEVDITPRIVQRLLKSHHRLQKAEAEISPYLPRGDMPIAHPPVVVGAGPAGYFAALVLARHGYNPVLLERGDDVDTRTVRVKEFWQKGELDPQSNVQFGEGGAGTFSDGKLTTRISDHRVSYVLKTFVENGAPSEILYKHKPHVGTDKLRTVVKGLRGQVESAGGQVRFRSRLTRIRIENGRVAAVEVNGREEIPTEVVILAIGHSARDTYAMLHELELTMESKAFAIGLRVEHSQKLIDRAQFGAYAGHPALGSADYQLAYKDSETGRGAYAFCMCPGGKVVGAASEPGRVVTNGMSEYARDTGVANSALVVSVNPVDFAAPEPLAGIEFQRIWERKAYELGGGSFKAPVQSVEDFLRDRKGDGPELEPSYLPGVEAANLHDALPKEIGEVLGRALENFDRKINGFIQGSATLTGVETRTSAPLRIVRDETMQSVNLFGLYPAGEGAGYAGGIMSAAVDGIKAAEAVIGKYASVERSRK